MTTIEIWLLAVGLAMDCFAISIASGILLKRTLWRPMLMMAFFFGLFQALMPLIGWACASTFSHLIEDVDLAVGVSFAFLGMKSVTTILSPVGIIGFVSFALSLIGLTFGIRFGCGFARRLKAERWGGVILILIGLKILIEHLIQHYG